MRNFIVGTDWATDCDDVVAMRVLTQAHKQGEICINGIVINACMEYSVPSLDGFLGLEQCGDIPIGIDLLATDFGGEPSYQKRLAPHYTRYATNEAAEDGVRLYRKLLVAAKERVEIVEIGFLQVFAALLNSQPDDISSQNGMDLVKNKVAKCWVMAGKWDLEGEKEHNFCKNKRARLGGKEFCEKCPVPITFLGWEVGFDVITGNGLRHDDHLWQALNDHGSPNGRCSWDPMLALLAVTGDAERAGYECVRGKATVDAETGKNYFVRDGGGQHSFVVKKEENAYYKNKINKIIEQR